ncbi:MAG: DUF4870 domain-containing protein [Bacteroidota bacterium]
MEAVRSEERTWGALTHILGLAGGIIPFGNIFGPLIMWQLKKIQSPFVDENGKAAVNFQISYTLYMIGLGLLFFVLFFGTIASNAAADGEGAGLPITAILLGVVLVGFAIFQLVVMIMGAIKASKGEVYHYPLTIQFIK